MAKHSQQQQETAANENHSVCGGVQAVVELCDITSCGLVSWSRRRFEIGAEMQVRIKRSALTPAMLAMTTSNSKWVMLKCLVATCQPQRRDDGSFGFQVSLLVVQASDGSTGSAKFRSQMNWFTAELRGRLFGLD